MGSLLLLLVYCLLEDHHLHLLKREREVKIKRVPSQLNLGRAVTFLLELFNCKLYFLNIS